MIAIELVQKGDKLKVNDGSRFIVVFLTHLCPLFIKTPACFPIILFQAVWIPRFETSARGEYLSKQSQVLPTIVLPTYATMQPQNTKHSREQSSSISKKMIFLRIHVSIILYSQPPNSILRTSVHILVSLFLIMLFSVFHWSYHCHAKCLLCETSASVPHCCCWLICLCCNLICSSWFGPCFQNSLVLYLWSVRG